MTFGSVIPSLSERQGEIIPEVLRVKSHLDDAEPYHLPEQCPVCHTPAVRDPDEAALRCPNPDCPAQLMKRMIHFVSKDAMNIDGLGPQNLAALQANDLVHSVADLYALTPEKLTKLDRFAEKSAENLVRAIATSKENSGSSDLRPGNSWHRQPGGKTAL